MMSSMFEIPILYVACDVKIVKERVSFFCSRVLRKIQLQKKLPCFGGLFFSRVERRGRDEENRIEATSIFI